jgi:lipopolysaccharide transport system ATP-binding protein
LGLSRAEIDDIFDDIAAFADIGQFMDQPVKLYSSGMNMRLAFAVQTFVPKAVMIVDEALAVGDLAFQRKCWATFEKFVGNGGTVLLVAHSMQTIVRLCERCLLLDAGKLLVDGPSKPVTDIYTRVMYSSAQTTARILSNLAQHGLSYALNQPAEEIIKDKQASKKTDNEPQIADDKGQQSADEAAVDWFDPNLPQPDEISDGNGQAEIIDFAIYNEQEKRVNVLVMGRRYRAVCRVQFYGDSNNVLFVLRIKTLDGIRIAAINSLYERGEIDYISASSVVEVSFSFKLNLAPNSYFLDMLVVGVIPPKGRTTLHMRSDMCMIQVLACDSRTVPWIAYLEPKFEYRFTTKKTEISNASERDFENGN